MLRIWFPLAVVSLLAACSSVPPQSSRSSGMTITTPRAYRPPSNFPNFVDHSVGQEEISIQAMSLVGVPYRWGGNTPDSGFDCSGLVRYVVGRAADVNLPRTTADMSGRGASIDPDQIAPGDLIFFNTTGRPHSHVGIYVGKLRFVNAPSTGGTVRLDYVTNPYWAKRFDGIRRVAPPRTAPEPFDTPTYEARRDAPPAAAAATLAAAPAPAAAAPLRPQPAVASAPPRRIARASIGADPYEPPPARLLAAQQQAEAAGAVAPDLANGPSDAAASSASATIPTLALQPAGMAASSGSADAFEPPPPTASDAARQTRMVSSDGVQVLRASTLSVPVDAPAGTSDDPIARFATSSY
ncbi:NLP/P60 protein [Burkholderia multivorans]